MDGRAADRRAPLGQHPGPGFGEPPAPWGHTAPPRAVRPPQKSAQRPIHKLWWVGGGAVALVAIVVAAIVIASRGDDRTGTTANRPAQMPAGATAGPDTQTPSASRTTAPPVPAGPVLAPEALPGLLLRPEEVSRHFNLLGMTPGPIDNRLQRGEVTPAFCAGPWGPVYEATYIDSGYTGVAVQQVERLPEHQVTQAVASFPDPEAATQFFSEQVTRWKDCGSTDVVVNVDGRVAEVRVGGLPLVSGGVLTTNNQGMNGDVLYRRCERDMTVRGNVIIDVRVCSPVAGTIGLSVAGGIAEKIR